MSCFSNIICGTCGKQRRQLLVVTRASHIMHGGADVVEKTNITIGLEIGIVLMRMFNEINR